MHIPVMQALLAEIVPEEARTRYMAVFNLNLRGGLMIASLSLTMGALLPPSAMAGLYVVLGALAVKLYRPLLRASPPPAQMAEASSLQAS